MGDGERGRNAEKSVVNSVRLTIAAHATTKASHNATAARLRFAKLTAKFR